MKITFHGVRGSVPVSGPKFSKYGGHTSCLEVCTQDVQLIIDDEIRMADARAMQESELVSLTKEEFEKIVSESNIFVRAILGILSERLRQAQKPKTM